MSNYKIILIFLTLGICSNLVSAKEIKIGVLAIRGSEIAFKRWLPTADYLSKQIPGHTFKLIPMTLGETELYVATSNVDFIVTNPGNYIYLESLFGISRVATLKSIKGDQVYKKFGAVIFSRSDRGDIQTIEDLQGKSLMAVSKGGFGGFQMAWYELNKHNISIDHDLREVIYAGLPQDNIVYAVLSGKVDVGTVRGEVLGRMSEEGKINLNDLFIINKQNNSEYPFLHSTRLYPEWPFAKLAHTPDDLAQQVTIALLNLPPDSTEAICSQSAGWTIPLDYTSVHELFKELKLGVYSDLGKVGLSAILKKYWHWIIVIALSTLILAISTYFVVRSNRKLLGTERLLLSEIEERKNAQVELSKYKDVLEDRVSQRTKELKELNRELEYDIEARQRMEKALLSSEKTLRKLHELTSSISLGVEEKVKALMLVGLEQIKAVHAVFSVLNSGALVPNIIINSDHREIDESVINRDSRKNDYLDCENDIEVINAVSIEKNLNNTEIESTVIVAKIFVEEKLYAVLEYIAEAYSQLNYDKVSLETISLIARLISVEIERNISQEKIRIHQANLAHVTRVSTVGEIASSLAHELNTPLTAVVNYINACQRILSRNDSEDDLIKQGMNDARIEAIRASDIIKRLRRYVTNHSPSRSYINLDNIFDSVLKLMEARFRESKVLCAVTKQQDVPEVKVDKILIEQVLLNLLLNSLESLDILKPNNQIKISAELKGEFVCVEVTDTGCGISPEKYARLFSPFFTSKKNGMGMGLSISKTIIESHGGDIRCVSTDITVRGSCFRFTLPIS